MHDVKGSRAFEGCELVVTRFPLMRTSAIKVFRSVSPRGDKGVALGRYFGIIDGEGSRGGYSFGGGVVVFSTQRGSDGDDGSNGSNGSGVGIGGLPHTPRVPCCPVACMGGDYDGDMYVLQLLT